MTTAGHPYLSGWRGAALALILWFAVPTAAAGVKYLLGPDHYNNYLIYKHVFWHVLRQQDLYAFHPGEYLQQNHYGPSFSLVIAPFAWLPDGLGVPLWGLANAAALFFAIGSLSFTPVQRFAVLSIVWVEMLGAVQNLQFNPMLCAGVILSYAMTVRGAYPAAAMSVAVGALTKLFGILGVLFVPFGGRYRRALLCLSASFLLLFLLPMAFSDPGFILDAYRGWFMRLAGKHAENIGTNLTDGMQDISAMGILRRVTGMHPISTLWFLLPAGVMMLCPAFLRSRHGDGRFRTAYLAQLLIGMVVFSTSSESPTYVIAVTGFAVWYASEEGWRSVWMNALLGSVLLLTVLSPTDLFPRWIRENLVQRYALKALPCTLAWGVITWRLLKPSSNTKHQTDVPAGHPSGA